MIFRYRVVEHDPDRPWVILGTRTGLSLEAADGHDFREKVQEEWPSPRFAVELAPGELMRSLHSRTTRNSP
jgi:hypothetical protein